MATVTRTISTTPYNGGSLLLQQPFSNATTLTSERMVWTWAQQNPSWRFFTVVDTPGGWANGGTPAITTNQMFDQNAWRGSGLMMQRLNDTTFVTWDQISSNGVLEVFEVGADNTVNLLYRNLSWTWNQSTSPTFSRFNNTYRMFRTNVDNQLMVITNANSQLIRTTAVWDPVAKTFTQKDATVLPGSGNSSGYMEMFSKPIPGSTKFMLGVRWGNNSSSYVPVTQWIYLMNADGTYNTGFAASVACASATDVSLLSETRMAIPTWSRCDYSNPFANTGQGGGPFTTTTSNNNMISYPISADYVLLLDRSGNAASTATANVWAKVIRREDSNIVSQSAASATLATGFKIAVPAMHFWWDKQRPTMLANGDIMWFGTVPTTGATQNMLTWTVLKNPV